MMNMNNEEFDRKMAFIVGQQAQFASDIQQLQESQARTDQVVAQIGDVVTRLANVTHTGFTEVNAKINALVDAQIRTEENLTRTEQNLIRTDKNVASTDESLKNLIALVERYLTGRNGK